MRHDAHRAQPPNFVEWPEDHRLTEFQQLVVERVAALEPGDLVSYSDVGDEIGRPGSGQAVANVLRHSVGLPWWRVIPSSGVLYRTHAPTQQPLLEAEGHHFTDDRRVVTE